MTIDLVSHEILTLRDLSGSTECDASGFNAKSFYSTFTTDELSEIFYGCWDLFNSAPFDAITVRLGSQEVEKRWLFTYLSHTRATRILFMENVLVHISISEIPCLANFLSGFFRYLIGRTNLEPEDAASLSDLILITWWDLGFATPTNYVHLSRTLYTELVSIWTDSQHNNTQLFTTISQYPEYAHVLMVLLLRLYSDLMEGCLAEQESSDRQSDKPTKNSASRMLGVHSSHAFQQLDQVYRETLHILDQSTEVPISTEIKYTYELFSTTVRILKQAVRCRSMVDSLYQHLELPFNHSEVDHSLSIRFALICDYLLVRACRYLSSHSEMCSTGDPFPSQFSCLIHATAPKHLIAHLLTNSVSLPTGSLPSYSAWDFRREASETTASFLPHVELMCRALDRRLNALGLASWFVQCSDPKDVHLANSLLSRLMKLAPLFAVNPQFALSLIIRIDRLRQLTLPEQNYLKFLRAILSHMSTENKVQLLHAVHSDRNPTHACPLSRNPNQLESRMRMLFNRLVVIDETDVNTSVGEAAQISDTKSTATIRDPEVSWS
ncbi:unnamed protein product [Echinostoma caproni]|uniref:Non-specific serine/threonine protein kinase n=1 Tax=Echinostoma caproni TaxID=27848 RepID=A0A183AJG7_9TREM|nr:unnamed protein product [Echinostoma caproni]